jgi:Mn-containing catalase
MFLRIDKLPVELPASPKVDPIAAKNVQELLGGRFGEMSTLMNYTYQSFAMRGRDAIRPYYALISSLPLKPRCLWIRVAKVGPVTTCFRQAT